MEQGMKVVAKRFTSDMLRLFRNASGTDGVEARTLALKWACRLEMASCPGLAKSLNGYDTCFRLLSPEYLLELRCNRRSFERLIHAIDIQMCFTSPESFQQFMGNVLQNFRCPAMLNLFVAVMKTGVADTAELLGLLETRIRDLEATFGGQHLEVFLRRAAYYIYDPNQQQLMIQFMERIEVITDEQRIIIRNLLAARLSSVARVSSSLQRYLKQAVTVIDYEHEY